MAALLQYLLYAAAFIAVVLAVEGLARLVRANLGSERAVAQRLSKARALGPQLTAGAGRSEGPLARALAERLPRIEQALRSADLPVSVAQVLMLGATVFLTVFMLLSLATAPGLLAFAAGLAAGAGAPVLIVRAMVAGRRRRFLDQLPQAVDLIARSLQAGHPVTSALTVVGQRMPAPLGPEFQTVVEEMAYGQDRDVALANLVARFPLPELRMFAASLQVTRESGGNLAEVFLKLAEAIRAKDHLRRKVHAISAEGRMSFWVVSGLPFAVGGFLMLARPHFYLDVAKDHLFWPMMAYAPISLAIGATMIWRLVNLKI